MNLIICHENTRIGLFKNELKVFITYQSYSNCIVVNVSLVDILCCRMTHTEHLNESLICYYATYACVRTLLLNVWKVVQISCMPKFFSESMLQYCIWVLSLLEAENGNVYIMYEGL